MGAELTALTPKNARYPNDQVVIIVLGNRQEVDTPKISVQLTKIVFGEK